MDAELETMAVDDELRQKPKKEQNVDRTINQGSCDCVDIHAPRIFYAWMCDANLSQTGHAHQDVQSTNLALLRSTQEEPAIDDRANDSLSWTTTSSYAEQCF